MALPDTTQEWIARYERNALKAEDNYQQTGIQRYDSQAYEYRSIVDAFQAMLKQEQNYHDDIRKRTTNCDYIIDRLVKDSYSRDEVKKLLRDAIYW